MRNRGLTGDCQGKGLGMGHTGRARDFSSRGGCGSLASRVVSPVLLCAACDVAARKSTQTHSHLLHVAG